MPMTRILSPRRRPVAVAPARTGGRPLRNALISLLCAAFCAVPVVGAEAQHDTHGGGGFHGGAVHGDFHGRDFNRFSPGELHVWRGGAWRHEWHDGRFAWWWVVDGGWYWYPEPIWPYPSYVPPAIVVQPPPPVVAGVPPVQFWYYCDNPRGYYPNVATCSVPWRSVPITSP